MKDDMQIISQRTKNSNCCSVQWLPNSEHRKLRFSREPETAGRGLPSLTLIYKLFIREVVGTQDLANGNLTPHFTLLNLKQNPKLLVM